MTSHRPSTRPLRVLLSGTARVRMAEQLAKLASDVAILTVETDDIDTDVPDVAYLSGDLFQAGLLPAIAALMQRGSGPRWVQSCSAGTDNPAFAAMATAGIRITKSTAQAPAIADYVLCQTLSLLHPLDEARQAQKGGVWQRLPFREIGDTRWTIVGFGAIGTVIATRLKAFGAHLTVVKRDSLPDRLADRTLTPEALLDALPDADVVVLACPLTPDTRGMADSAFFAALKPGAVFVNIGRGALVDDAALLAGLDTAQPAVAVLDVFTQEPLPASSPFWMHPAVRVTAHGAGAGSGVAARNDALFLDNLDRYRRNLPLIGEVAPSDIASPDPATVGSTRIGRTARRPSQPFVEDSPA